MQKSKGLNATSKRIVVWITIQAIIIIVTSILSFLFVLVSSRLLYGGEPIDREYLHYVAGTIIPMCAMIGALSLFLSKHTYGLVSTITDGIEKMANGDYSVRLDETKSGVFTEVYKNINKLGAELQNVHMLRNDFINSYSHEFKTPITSINGFAALLLETDVSEEDRDRYLHIIVDESARLADLANSTILLSKLDSQQIVENKEPYALDEQLRRCVIMLSSSWNAKNITMSGEIEEFTYNGSAQMMQHVWLNLINNAIKFTPEHGEIIVSLTQRDGAAIVSVSDTGIGMSEDTIAHIFEKYYQSANAQSRQGLGLGLSIVFRIVEMCGGTIQVTSKIGEGSTFTVTLPN